MKPVIDLAVTLQLRCTGCPAGAVFAITGGPLPDPEEGVVIDPSPPVRNEHAMTIRILTLAVPDGRQFYAACGDCGFLSIPYSEWLTAERLGHRHVCRNRDANRASLRAS